MNNDIIETSANDQELTLVDIEELRDALGAEAELRTSADASAAPSSTVMCPQWY